MNYADLLGEVQRDENGRVVGAKSALHLWVTAVNKDAIIKPQGGAGIELDLADELSLDWENEVVDTMLEFASNQTQDLTVLANVARRYIRNSD